MPEQQPQSPYEPGMKRVMQAHTAPHRFGMDYRNAEAIRRPVRGLHDDDQINRLDFALSLRPHTRAHLCSLLLGN